METPQIIEQAEVISRLQSDIETSFATIEHYLPQIGHSEAKRLFLAATKYPSEVADFSTESEAMIRLFSASKTVKDALVAMGVEVVITKMLENQYKAQQGEEIAPVSDEVALSPEATKEITEFMEQEPKASPKKRAKKEKA